MTIAVADHSPSPRIKSAGLLRDALLASGALMQVHGAYYRRSNPSTNRISISEIFRKYAASRAAKIQTTVTPRSAATTEGSDLVGRNFFSI